MHNSTNPLCRPPIGNPIKISCKTLILMDFFRLKQAA
jgi:hypothetical protein